MLHRERLCSKTILQVGRRGQRMSRGRGKNVIKIFSKKSEPRDRILRRNPDKSPKSFPSCLSQSPLQLCLEISISSNSRNLLHISTVQYCTKKRRKEKNQTPFPMVSEIHTETSSLRIMPRNLDEIVCS
jgi:hypothetical protein